MELEYSSLSRGRFAALVAGLGMLGLAFHVFGLFDFRIFFDASHRLLAGKDLYPSRAQVLERTRDYYVLPPIVAFLCVPLSWLPFAIAGSLYALGMVAALVGALRVCGVTDQRCYIALLLWMPVLQTVGLGTIEPVLVLALALAWRYRDDRLLGTVPLGFAIAAKLFLWPVLLWLLFTGRIRRSVEAATATLVMILVPWAVLGFHELSWYPHMLDLLVKTEQATSWALPSSSMFGTTFAAVGLVTVAILFALSRSFDSDRKVFTASVLACLLLSPLVWLHYYVILIVPIALASRRFSRVWVVPALAIWPFADSHDALGVKLYAYVLLAIVALFTLRPGAAGSTSIRLRRRAATRPSGPAPGMRF